VCRFCSPYADRDPGPGSAPKLCGRCTCPPAGSSGPGADVASGSGNPRLPPVIEAHINGADCLLADATTAANTDTATGDCTAGTPGADTIELLSEVTLTAVNNTTFGSNGGSSL
jgi:hypothetical protein